MGFFDSQAICAACNKEVGLNRYQIANKEWICPECYKKCGFSMSTPIRKYTVGEIKAILNGETTCVICKENFGHHHIANNKVICHECFMKCGFTMVTPLRSMTADDIQEAMKNNATYLEALDSFNPTKKISTFIEFDETQQKWLIPDGFMGGKKRPKIYNYSDIVDFELLEDGESLIKGGLGRAVVGGVLLGGLGAVVGGVTGKRRSKPICNSLKIKITVNDMSNPVVYINFIKSATKKASLTYKTMFDLAQECLSVLDLICKSIEPVKEIETAPAAISAADEILKFKSLMDSGIITQEEFEAKKKQLLGL